MSFESLPDEILEKIFLELSPYKEFDKVALVCRRWNRIMSGAAGVFRKNFRDAFKSGKVSWTEIHIDKDNTPGNVSLMSARLLHCMCYNDCTRSAYVFGGRSVGSHSAGFNDLWRFDMHTKRWERPIANGSFPQPKFGSSLESYKSHLILYGGRLMPSAAPFMLRQQDHCSDDLHVFDTELSKWRIIHTVDEAPPPLYLHGTCVVTNEAADDCMVLFGGIEGTRNTDNNSMWCLDLPGFHWWKPKIIGPCPPPRHMHSQASLKSGLMFSSAVVIVGGSTVTKQILSDAWILVRSGFREWTSSCIEIQHGPNDFTPPISVFRRRAVKVGQCLLFFGNTPPNVTNPQKVTGWALTHRTRKYVNPLCMYVLDLAPAISSNSARWATPLSTDASTISGGFLGPEKPNFHIAVATRGHIIILGDSAAKAPQQVRGASSQSSIPGRATNKFMALYLIAAHPS